MTTNRHEFFGDRHALDKKLIEEIEQQNEAILNSPDNMMANRSRLNSGSEGKPQGIGMHLRQKNYSVKVIAGARNTGSSAALPKK